MVIYHNHIIDIMLSESEKKRYLRQMQIDGWGMEGQLKLKNTTVFVAGCGGSASPTLTQLALLGIGHLRICDFDCFEETNRNRQFIHEVGEDNRIGMNKAESAYKTIKNINPFVDVTVFTEKITEDNINEYVGDAQIIFDCVDGFETKFLISKCAVKKKIPHMFFGMFDINIFACIFDPPQTPCFHCLFDYEKLLELEEMRKMYPNDISGGMKMTIPVCAPSLFQCTGFLITEMLKMLLGLGPVRYNEYVMFLQKDSEQIVNTAGYQGMRFWNTDFFEEISMEQGYDWDKGYRGKTFEQLKIRTNPKCSCCRCDKE